MFSILINTIFGFWSFRGFCKRFRNSVLKPFVLFLYRLYEKGYCSYVPLSVTFDSEPNLPHGINCVHISGAAKIGRNVSIYQNVTIGSVTFLDSSMKGAPVVGDNVVIGAGAVIIGNVNIGNNARIAPNSLITKDVPSNSIFINGKIIVRQNLDNRIFLSKRGKTGYLHEGKVIYSNEFV